MKQTNELPIPTEEKGNPITFWGGLAEPKQEKDYTALLKPVGTKQTAVEWLIEEVECRGILTKELRLAFEQAKEMAKQQQGYSEEDMLKSFIEGHNVCRCVTDNTDEAKECFEEWFKQFKNK